MILGGLEAGGTKMVCLIGDETGKITERATFSTLTPSETMPALIDFFRMHEVDALGIGSFGPLELNRQDRRWGYITSTPKLAWRDFDLAGTFSRALDIPVGLDTDVNAAAMAEARLGAAHGLESCVYITVGTGIGGGIFLAGKPLHGLVHPEFGHIPLRSHPDDPTPKGFCPYHTGCLEGLANGPAISERWGKPGRILPPDHPAWPLEAFYLAQACMAAILTLSPHRIVMGGGVMHQTQLFPMIHTATLELLGGYVQHERILRQISDYIVPPGLGDDAGGVGSLLLGLEATQK